VSVESAPSYEAKKTPELSLKEISKINYLLIQEIKSHTIYESGIEKSEIECAFEVSDRVDSRMIERPSAPLRFEINGVPYSVRTSGYLGEGYIAQVLDLKREDNQTKLTLDTLFKKRDEELFYMEGVAFLRDGIFGKDLKTKEDFDTLSHRFPEFPLTNCLT